MGRKLTYVAQLCCSNASGFCLRRQRYNGSRFRVYDLGVDVPIVRFNDTARKVGADIIWVSAFLTATMVRQRKINEKVHSGERRKNG